MWLSNSNRKLHQEKWHSIIRMLEDDCFVGRDKEIELFRDFLDRCGDTKNVLNLYGTGGIGKTTMLQAFQRVAENVNGLVFILLDSEDFLHSTSMLAEQILLLMESKVTVDASVISDNSALTKCFYLLEEATQEHHIIIAVDTYEKMEDRDRWFREFFLRNLPSSISVIIAGRHPLNEGWNDSPAWRSVITHMELHPFNYDQTRLYLNKSGVKDEEDIQEYWNFTRGHPLTLSLSAMAGDPNIYDSHHPQNKQEILTYLTSKWLSEVSSQELQELLEAAAVLRHFDQATLSYILNCKISTTTFSQLTSLSFVHNTNHGWGIHEIIRSAILLDIQKRTPDHYHSMKDRCASYYLQRINTKPKSDWEISEFFYHLGEEVIQSVFFQESAYSKKYMEQVGPHNFEEVKEYFEKRRKQFNESIAHYYHRETDKMFKYFVSAEHNQRENNLIGAEYVKKLGYSVSNLVKDEEGKTIGLSIVVPINEHTMHYLKKEPVSRAYFNKLSLEEEIEYRVPGDSFSGWFIRMLDCLNPEDSNTRSFLLYNLFPLLLSGGRIITSTPIPFFQKLSKAFGFEKVPGATHYDFGAEHPSPTYILDVRGPRLIQYLKQFTQSNSSEKEHVLHLAKRHQLTQREEEILLCILEEYSNKSIAEQLFITEITVKKHVSKILKKFNVKNRTQLMKRLLEISNTN
ncbi:AAA family ATPase [Pontibacillus yanchengensis]|uniref:AAA family ATPase n=1 Tax=Pontibacillus yanchengensis TaxID=462910 RepID=A0A6I4ZXA2_9BACI|nr:LuxR C-terminal-related transcriptional regulator [Pontibacillus yanchengensis]MYL32580.1 AAA family ATPase [Pontibacillus yanchengensis]